MRPTAIPGLPGWGAKSTAAVLARYGHLEAIPEDSREWRVNAASAATLAATLLRERDRAYLFRDLATLRTDIPLFESVDDLRWNGPTPAFEAMAARLDAQWRRPHALGCATKGTALISPSSITKARRDHEEDPAYVRADSAGTTVTSRRYRPRRIVTFAG